MSRSDRSDRDADDDGDGICVYQYDAKADPGGRHMAAFFTAALESQRWQELRTWWTIFVVVLGVPCGILAALGHPVALLPWPVACAFLVRAVVCERRWRRRLARFETRRLQETR